MANGTVYLIGAGPGAQDLITVRGARLLAQAQVVLHDALVSGEMLALCPQALLVDVGKRCGQQSARQDWINQQLLDYAAQYQVVVRLKGGDPMLFGRADEELSALEDAGVAYHIVPGITTALAAAAAAKAPLTRRGVARSVALFTSSTAPEHAEPMPVTPDADTLVQYMGGREAIATAQRLLGHGRAPQTPVVVVENCSRPEQRIVRIDLAQLAEGLTVAHGPVLVMIGEALRLRAGQQAERAPD
ncbi:uroporphyrinogen-III C-methyltransferase [Massilia sp. PWRC2]|uniref:uroporphyrinogen-III C-methyltransferase n=1 Tax=Massilia sp. PWRC2 TaxID=2804626 RepID=UPI003CEB3965